ncbi:MAG: PHP domain-containing protein [Candidatus Aminicenantes bacterium]|nr:PHP domain-containing protein [Candidatus Aminicenantes bacterium]
MRTNDNCELGILDPGRARRLLAEGWQAADLHVHTLHSLDVIPTRQVDPLVLYHKARRLGMSYVVFTDHDTIAAYDQIGWTREGLVPAVEVKILDAKNVGHTVHVNVYTLNRAQYAEIRKLTGTARDIGLLTDYLRAEGLPFVYNHPFWHEPGETLNIRAVLDIAPLFPVLEYNMGRTGRINAQALNLASTLSQGIVAGTDSHVGEIGRAFSLARGGTFKEFFAGIAARESYISPADLTLSRLKEETSTRIRRLFDRAAWLHAKETLAMETGSPLLDAIVRRAARRDPNAPDPIGWVIGKAVEALSSTGIPGSLYLRSQDGLADRIGRLMESAKTAA